MWQILQQRFLTWHAFSHNSVSTSISEQYFSRIQSSLSPWAIVGLTGDIFEIQNLACSKCKLFFCFVARVDGFKLAGMAWSGVWEMNLWRAKSLVRAAVAHVQSLTRVQLQSACCFFGFDKTNTFLARKKTSAVLARATRCRCVFGFPVCILWYFLCRSGSFDAIHQPVSLALFKLVSESAVAT